MKPVVSGYYDAQVPRYTSYPTAPHFHDGVDTDVYGEWLTRIAAEDKVSLYFHVPFCTRMCWYCGCHTRIVGRYEPVHRYVDVLAREMDMVAGAIADRPLVTHVHWGGGTPTMLSPDDFNDLMSNVARRFRIAEDAEIAVEIDPRTLDKEKISALAAAGVTRASLGIQDLTPEVQRAVNRVQPFEMVADAVAALRDAGITQINFDLMYGLPFQTVDDVVATVGPLEPVRSRGRTFGRTWLSPHRARSFRCSRRFACRGGRERRIETEFSGLHHGPRRNPARLRGVGDRRPPGRIRTKRGAHRPVHGHDRERSTGGKAWHRLVPG
jgi:oxygen-independent coproporphyrinogen-3 oxidase